MICFDQVSFGYGAGQTTLEQVSFTIGEGEFVAVVGSNGAGKSTLSKLCNGLLKPSSGSVTVMGMDTRTTRTSVLARQVGFLFQNPDRQICQNTIREELAFGLRLQQVPADETKARVERILEEFAFDPQAAPFSLSRGERQRLALASLLVLQPKVLILDEPTTGLDYRECMHIMDRVRQLHNQGTTVIMVSHDMEVVQDFALRVMVVHEGRLLGDGPVRWVLSDRALLSRASLLPPQIADLALELGPAFDGVFTVEEMDQRIREVRGS